MTSSALALCLFVSVASPQVGVAAAFTRQDDTVASRAVGEQRFAVAGGATVSIDRDTYSIGFDGERIETGAVRPVDGTIPTAGGFGSRYVLGCGACSTNHHGLDFAAATGTSARSVLAGVVVEAGWSGGYGMSVVVRHADGLSTRYAHLSHIEVGVGQEVVAGTVIGLVGSTGVSTGSHLHFEVLQRGTAVDPAGWLRVRGLL